MTEVAKKVDTAAVADVKKSSSKAKKTAKSVRPKISHPTTAVMVYNAIADLKERGGSSLQAIKKYISGTYKIDTNKLAPFIKKYLKASVASGALVQTKGKGPSGSFKLAVTAVTKSKTVTKDTKAKTPVAKAPKEVKPKVAKKAASKPKAKAAGKTRSATKSVKKTPVKSVSKPTTKKAKSPAKKPKAPKPKTTKRTQRK